MMIGLGVLLILLAILAGVSLFSRNRFPFLTFLVLSILTAIVHIGLGIYTLILGSRVTEVLSSPVIDQIFLDPAVMNMLQSTLKCCGITRTALTVGYPFTPTDVDFPPEPPLPSSSSFSSSSASTSSSSSSSSSTSYSIASTSVVPINTKHSPDTPTNTNIVVVSTCGEDRIYTCLHWDRTFTSHIELVDHIRIHRINTNRTHYQRQHCTQY
nr:unnamed protein product [Spirometra erinaceieuropaei]